MPLIRNWYFGKVYMVMSSDTLVSQCISFSSRDYIYKSLCTRYTFMSHCIHVREQIKKLFDETPDLYNVFCLLLEVSFEVRFLTDALKKSETCVPYIIIHLHSLAFGVSGLKQFFLLRLKHFSLPTQLAFHPA